MSGKYLTDHPATYHVIGCGGIGSWLTPLLVRVAGDRSTIYLWDADKLEEGNLDRQLFSRDMVGRNKAEALARITKTERKVTLEPICEYFHSGSSLPSHPESILCCADNHSARRAALDVGDVEQTSVIIGANEYTESEAYLYTPNLRGQRGDPRVWMPDILTDHTGDPRSPAGCTGAAADATPQLVLANASAAVMMMRHLWYFHKMYGSLAEASRACEELMEFMPIHHRASDGTQSTMRVRDK